MFAFLKAVHYLSLLWVGGAPAFWLAVWRPVYGGQADAAAISARLASRMRRGVVVGAVVFVISGLAEAVRAASQVVDTTVFEELWLFLTASRYGQMSLCKAVIAPIFAGVFLLTYRRAGSLASVLTGVVGLALLVGPSLQ